MNPFVTLANSISTPVRNFFGLSNPNGNSNSNDPTRAVGSPFNMGGYINKVQFTRERPDLATWRLAIGEAENPWYPHRVRMQRIFQDTILDGQVRACMNKRKNLTLLKGWAIVDSAGKKNDEWTKFFEGKWFRELLNYTLDAQFFSYSLINFGDIVDGKFSEIKLIPRQNVSPDRLNMTSIIYSNTGFDFMEDPYADWNLYVSTPSELGVSKCGYGLLYQVAKYEILNRNLLGNNADFVELYAQPYRVGKTTKTQENPEYRAFVKAIQDMGNSGWAVMDPSDEIEFIETALGGTGWRGYENLELRNQKIISKIILGHADAIDSVAGKLGSSQEYSPSEMALDDIQSIDKNFCETVINDHLLLKLRNLGFNIPMGLEWKISNDSEEANKKRAEDESNAVVADYVLKFSQAGLDADINWVNERTGMNFTKKPVVAPPTNPAFSQNMKNRLNKIYNKHAH